MNDTVGYAQIPLVEAWCNIDAGPSAPEAAVWTRDSLRGRPLPEQDAVVYMLAFARQQPFYANVASDIASAYAVRNAICRAQQRRYGRDGITPLYCVYFECNASNAMAEARCVRIKTMPHAWQRQLIDLFNAEWLNVIDELIAYPCSTHCIGERGMMKLSAMGK